MISGADNETETRRKQRNNRERTETGGAFSQWLSAAELDKLDTYKKGKNCDETAIKLRAWL
jgi:hypothetical protein